MPLDLAGLESLTEREEIMLKDYKFYSTGQFRNAVKSMQHKHSSPKIDYVGTVKLHGTNASIIAYEDGSLSFHSKSNMLATVVNGEFKLLSDNFSFAQSMWERISGVLEVVGLAKEVGADVYGEVEYPITISGEWCGQGIQKGVGISKINHKSLFIFGLKFGVTTEDSKSNRVGVKYMAGVHSNENHLYNITQFPTQEISIDFQYPDASTEKLVLYTELVEKECPVSKALGVEGDVIGEGLVWTPSLDYYNSSTENFFKTKGKKHSVSKTKSVAAVSPEKVNSIKEFVEYAITDQRLSQGVQETGDVDQKNIGKFIGWVSKDIHKEESDTLESNGLTMKDVGSHIARVSREYYLGRLAELVGP